MNPDTRWLQRLDSFQRAVGLLHEALADGPGPLSQLEREGAAQRFEFTVELAWKTLADYLAAQAAPVQPPSPKAVVKAAFAAGILADGQLWIDMLDLRNQLSHVYDGEKFDAAVAQIHAHYLLPLATLREWFAARAREATP